MIFLISLSETKTGYFPIHVKGRGRSVVPTNGNVPSQPALECYWSCSQTNTSIKIRPHVWFFQIHSNEAPLNENIMNSFRNRKPDGFLSALMNRHHPEMQFDRKSYQTSEKHRRVYKCMIIHPTPDRTNTENNTSYQW